MNINKLSTNYLRVQSVNMIERAHSGHPGICLDAAPILFALYKNLKFDPKEVNFFNRDRVCLSAGHCSALAYATLNLFGYKISMEDLKAFKMFGSKTKGHPCITTPGIDDSTGPLGQGIANAVGMAIAEQYLAKKFNKEDKKIIDHYTYALVGEGCLMEGVGLEAINLAGNLKLNKLILLYDCNNMTIEGSSALAQTENIKMKFISQGWKVIFVNDGNSVSAIEKAINKAKKSDRPTIIVVKTTIGYGSPLEGQAKVHGTPIGESGIRFLKEKLKYKYEDFIIPENVSKNAEKLIQDAVSKVDADKKLLDEYRVAYEEDYKELNKWLENKPVRMASVDINYNTEISSREACNIIMNTVKVPNIIGGCADLAPSTKAYFKDTTDFSATDKSGRNIHFGIREHAMGSIVNGIVLHGGLRAFGSTFFSFSNYMLPSLRMAALMDIPSMFIFSHDSIAVGQDGSTHQPIEQLTQLRAIPNLTVYRPANTMETLAGYYIGLNSQKPTALITSRQGLEPFECELTDALKGGYVVSPGKKITLVATGSEVALALKVKKKLSKNFDCSVVSMPSIEVFEEQPKIYKESVLPADNTIFAIEASNDNVWYKLGATTHFGVHTFGQTGSMEELYEHFDLTVDKIAKEISNIVK